jgi:RNA polymerase sigma factor (TIGR02999 family)
MGEEFPANDRKGSGSSDAADPAELLSKLYTELRRLAAQKLSREDSRQTLQATALVHEAWLRLGGDKQPTWSNQAHFFAAAAEAMRRILVDSARRKRAQRRGGGMRAVNLDFLDLVASASDEHVLAIHEALDEFAERDPVKAELVKLRFFGGLTLEEVAQALDISTPTAKRYWTFARAWLYRRISSP